MQRKYQKTPKLSSKKSCGESELNRAREKLVAGFNKISVSCGASSLVFADYPNWRAQRNKYYGATFRGGEGFPVIYQLYHHDLRTQDHRYDHHGLKPDKASFPYAKAIENADS